MKKTILTLLGLGLATSAYGASGMFGSYTHVTTNGSGTWYDLTAPGGGRASDPTDFDGHDLGTFDTSAGNTLTLTGGEGLTYKNGGSDVTGVVFSYSVQPVGGTHSFTDATVGFTANATFADAAGTSYSGAGDQKWSDSSSWAPVDLLSGLSNGDYELQVFIKATSTDGDHFHNNGGSNFTATFAVVPEPSSAALLGLGGLALILRRRK